MKSASGVDTAFSLDTAILILSAPGVPDQVYRYPITGRADLQDIEATSPVYSLAPLRKWKARIITIDTSISPLRRDTVHMDSVTFGVSVNDTTEVNTFVSPVYSVLRVRFLSTVGDSLASGIRYLRVRVNNVTRDSLFISSASGGANTAVFFPSITTGWMANDAGSLLKSTDSGNTWTLQTNPAGVKMNALWFNSTSLGWAVGEGGAIVKSNGTTWSTQSSGVSERLNGVMFVSSTKGYAVGDAGRVLKTLDGGSSWNLMSGGWFSVPDGVSNALNGIAFADVNTGWAVADGGVLIKTTNSGASWSTQTSNTTNNLKSVHALSTSNAVAVGAGGVIRRTTNGGSSWSTISSGVTSELRDVHFASSSYGWAVGASGVIRRSGDGGATWSTQNSGVTSQLNSVSSNGVDRVLAVGSGGVVRRRSSISNTSDFTDASNAATGSVQLNGVYMQPSTNNAWVVGNGGFIAKSTNSSNNNWTAQTSGTTQNLLEVYFADANNGWVTGANGTILVTTNGGTNWSVQASGTTQSLNGVHAVSADTIFAVGAGGTLLKTRSGGEITTTSNNLNAVYFRGDTGYVVGDAGTSLRTPDGGVTWSVMTGSTKNLYATFVSPSGNNVYAVGEQGTYMTSSNATFASTWDVRNSGTTQTLRGVWVSATDPGPASIYAAGDNGVIRVRNDGSIGDLNQGVSTGTTETLWGLQCLGLTNNCWAVGGGETVLRTTTADVSGWVRKSGGAKTFDELLTYKYLKPGQSNTVVIQAIDRESPLRGYQATVTLNLGAGQDSTLVSPMSRCGYGGASCSQ